MALAARLRARVELKQLHYSIWHHVPNVLLGASLALQSGAFVAGGVAVSGPVLDADDVSAIFARFHRRDGRRNGHRGAGLATGQSTELAATTSLISPAKRGIGFLQVSFFTSRSHGLDVIVP